MSRILIADDDRAMLTMVEQVLLHEGYDVETAGDVEEALDVVETSAPDLFLIDLGLPRVSGVELCRRLRANPTTSNNPIIFLTGQANTYSAVEALEAGGDDYIRKPFAVRELTARIRAHLRRFKSVPAEDQPVLRLHPKACQVYIDGREEMLTRVEFDLLNYLCQEPGKWFATHELLTGVWNYPEGVGDTALVRNHVRNLRRKLEIDPDYPEIIQSRHGRGYSIRARVQFAEPAL